MDFGTEDIDDMISDWLSELDAAKELDAIVASLIAETERHN